MLTCTYFTCWSDVPEAGAGLYSGPERMIVALPTNDGRTLTIVFFPNDAFRDAELLIEALDVGLSGKLPPEEALANYEQRCNEAALPMYELTHQLAALQPPPPEMQQLVAVLCHNQEQTRRFSGTITGTVPIAEFFAPENPRADHGHHNQGFCPPDWLTQVD